MIFFLCKERFWCFFFFVKKIVRLVPVVVVIRLKKIVGGPVSAWIKKIDCHPDNQSFVNLKSNTMKNTVQNYS